MFWPYYDPTVMVLIPAMLLAMWAQLRVKATFGRYSRVPSTRGLTGAQVARSLLNAAGLHDVPVEPIRHHLGDHYDPRQRRMRLSPEVYSGTSLAAIGVAAHETGHALQHQQHYMPLQVRNGIYPVAAFGSNAAFPLVLLGLITGATGLLTLGIWLFIGALAFQLITLPVEFNASSRAMRLLADGGYVQGNEASGVRAVLQAAALTYVAAVAVAISQLIRLLILRGASRDE
ncbi:MAG: zinc metallopeptidase [Limnochordia bacterium]|jgi:Zn-dependent membrane protease YugP